ncbi:hypothetical protein [Chitinophaga caeni]|nr:hypothetical protein [Chitinophaga caeni]
MSIISMFKNNQEQKSTDTDQPVLPWEQRPAIFEILKANLDENDQPIVQELPLPDEDRIHIADGNQLQWAAGARDGVLTFHANPAEITQKAVQIAELVKAIADNNGLDDRIALYGILMKDDVLHYLDTTIEHILNLSVKVRPYLHAFARWLAFHAPDRGAVKFGMALLGLIRDKEDMENICILGAHDEFTLFAVVAIVQMSDNPEGTLWRLGKKVHGWGRIHIVRRLLDTKDEDIKSWLMVEGFRNTVMNEYLAYPCAVAGNLRTALLAKDIDEEMLDAAGEIIQALINPGPMEGIDEYDDGPVVIQRYISHLLHKANTLHQYILLQQLSTFLQDPKANWDARIDYGWSEDLRSDLLFDIHQILASPHWKHILSMVMSDLNTQQVWEVAKVSDALDINIEAWCWERLQQNPTDETSWYLMMKRMTLERLPELLSFAKLHIPLQEIAIGAAKELGFNKAFTMHRCLDCLLLKLGEFPGYGYEFVEAATRSPVIRNRNNAVKVLESWGKSHWQEGTWQLLQTASQVEPNEDVNGKMLDLLEL